MTDEPLPGMEPKPKGDDITTTTCCNAPLQLMHWGWRCSECRRRIPD